MASGQFAVACRQVGRLFHQGTTAGLAEGQLLDRFVARRDAAAFEAIVARHGPMVLAVCRSLLRDPNDVDDAFQATFLVLVRKAETLRRHDLLGGWLHAVANRVARRARYEAGRRKEREASRTEPGGPADSEVDRLDLRSAVHDEVDRLPAPYREAVILCDLRGRTHEEASRELGWPVGTVKGRLSRARGLLRDRLVRRGLAPSTGAVLAVLVKDGRAAVPPALLESTASAASAVAAGPLAVAGAASARALDLTQGVLTTMTSTTTKLKLAATTLVVAALAGPGTSAYQFFGRPVPGQPAAPTEPRKPAAARAIVLGRRADQARRAGPRRDRANGEKGPRSPPRPARRWLQWQRRLAEARVEAGTPRAEAFKPYLDAADRAAKDARRLFESGEMTSIEYLEAQFRHNEAAKLLESHAPPATPPLAPQQAMGGGGMGGGMISPIVAAGGALDGDPEAPSVRPHKTHPADLERNKLIEERLEKEVVMNFANETPLEDALKYIKESTKDAKGKTIPIYVDPIGIQEAEKTPQSTVKLDIEDVPLRTTLRLMLNQLELDYRVRDGMLYIASREKLNQEDEEAEIRPGWRRSRRDGSTKAPVWARWAAGCAAGWAG